MSAEGKKKRGASGVSKAKSSPFRLNGLKANRTEIALRGVQPNHTGTHMVRGAIGGMLAAQLGYQMNPSQRLADLIDRSLEKCPVGSAVFDQIGQIESQQLAAE